MQSKSARALNLAEKGKNNSGRSRSDVSRWQGILRRWPHENIEKPGLFAALPSVVRNGICLVTGVKGAYVVIFVRGECSAVVHRKRAVVVLVVRPLLARFASIAASAPLQDDTELGLLPHAFLTSCFKRPDRPHACRTADTVCREQGASPGIAPTQQHLRQMFGSGELPKR